MLTLSVLIPVSFSLYKVVNYDRGSETVLKICTMSNFQVYEARDNRPNSTEETYQSTTAGLLSERSGDSGVFTRDSNVRTTTIDSGEYTEYITPGTVRVFLAQLIIDNSLFLKREPRAN